MVAVVAALLLGLVLVGAAAMKLAGGEASRAALATYGIGSPAAARAAWAALIGVEAALGVGVAVGLDAAAYAGAALMAGATAAQAGALASGREGAPCGCFGARGRVGRGSMARAGALAAALAILPQLPRSSPSTEAWLAIGLVAALVGLVALGVVVLALAREVGMLRLAVGPQGALEIDHEGPEVGAHSALTASFGDRLGPGRVGLAVFTSEGCGMCRALRPAVEAFGRDPRVVLRTFDEHADADAWAVADVPGSPFAVALGPDGTVLAKGTFNTGAQLESILAAAERRQGVMRA